MGLISFKRLSTGNDCPQCSEGRVQRVRRRDWMRRLPWSKYYKCSKCRARFLGISCLTVRLQEDGRPVGAGSEPE